jgi:hypothetical protein
MRIGPSVLALATLLLSSCASYEAPKDGPVAFLTLVGPSNFAIGYGSYCSTKDILPSSEKTPLRIKAGIRTWLQVNSGGSWGRCRGEISFVPAPGSHYVGRFQACSFSMAQALPGGGLGQVPSAVIEPERTCLLGG